MIYFCGNFSTAKNYQSVLFSLVKFVRFVKSLKKIKIIVGINANENLVNELYFINHPSEEVYQFYAGRAFKNILRTARFVQ